MDLEFYKKSADYVKSKIDFKPDIAIILGSGLGKLSDEIEDAVVISYNDIPNFLVSTAPSHAGKLIIGKLAGKKVICMSGRFHYYEGYDYDQLSLPVRLFKLLGVEMIIATNAAGAVNTGYRPGDVMVITDHINLSGATPMRGKNIPEFGPRFFDCTNVYDRDLRALALETSKESALRFHEGVYMFTVGPQFETPAEIKLARLLGADAVGMSTVTEALTAAHCKIPFLGFSLITNMGSGILPQKIDGAEVEEIADRSSSMLREYVKKLIAKM